MNRTLTLTISIALALIVCANVGAAVAQTAAGSKRSLPPLPKQQSPVVFFRKLLAATPSERDEMLKTRSAASRAVIEAKIEEYTILPPPVREWRLKATELRYYLIPLMKRPADQRGNLVEMVPASDRGLVELRLRQWDALPEGERGLMLDSQIALRYLARPGSVPMPPPPSAVAGSRLEELERKVVNWQQLSLVERNSITEKFDAFFDLSPSEKKKTIAVMTGIERAHLQQTVRSFEGMSDEDRDRCVVAMNKIAGMSDEERAVFLNNVDRWKSLSERDRHQWRTLVAKMPPLPPGYRPSAAR